jgi:RNA polymerase sigma-70 factor (ECF subfamily)
MSTTLLSAHPVAAIHAHSAELVAAARAGDPKALQQLMGSLLRPIKAAVGGTIGSQHPDFDDVVQESLIRVQQALSGYRGDCSPASYARLIATREALRSRRRSRRRISWLLLDPLLVEDAASPNAGTTFFHDRVWQLVHDRVWQLVAELPEKQAQAFVLRFGLGLSLAEIAGECGVPLNTIRSRIIAARRTLQGLLSFRGLMLDA